MCVVVHGIKVGTRRAELMLVVTMILFFALLVAAYFAWDWIDQHGAIAPIGGLLLCAVSWGAIVYYASTKSAVTWEFSPQGIRLTRGGQQFPMISWDEIRSAKATDTSLRFEFTTPPWREGQHHALSRFVNLGGLSDKEREDLFNHLTSFLSPGQYILPGLGTRPH